MINLKLLLEEPEKTRKALAKKGYTGNLDEILELDKSRRTLHSKSETLQAEQNRIAKEIPKASGTDKPKLLEESKKAKEEIKALSVELEAIEKKLNELALTIPNPPHESVPEGTEADNKPFEFVVAHHHFSSIHLEHEITKFLNLLPHIITSQM